jgi:hypothetical protein
MRKVLIITIVVTISLSTACKQSRGEQSTNKAIGDGARAGLIGVSDEPKFDSSVYYKITAAHSGLVLDILGGSLEPAYQAVQFHWHNGESQHWQLIPDANNYYKIKNRRSGLVLDIHGASTDDRADCKQHREKGSNDGNQKFKIAPHGSGGYTIAATHSGKCLDVYLASQIDQASIVQYPCHGGDNQRWLIDVTPVNVVLDTPKSTKPIPVRVPSPTPEPSTPNPAPPGVEKVCAGSVKAGWIKTDDEWLPTTCGNPSKYDLNVWTIKRYDNLPVGSGLDVCAGQQIPPGWVITGKRWIPGRCGHPLNYTENVLFIKKEK